ncbi:MAG TPA: PrgI family protein [Candidatus Dormibacteraeota bacterium]|jgi:MinD-like ATPase involved in chromosome partitioning or flagellar assembly|nr:PrgI family protein [Candidatus Dormibacteraeota bacterium]
MEGPRVPQGLDIEDRLAFGLTAPHLAYLVLALLSAYAVVGAPTPELLRYPAAMLIGGCGVALAWGRFAGRPLDQWAWLWLRFHLRPRRSPDAPRVVGDGGAPGGGGSTTRRAPARNTEIHSAPIRNAPLGLAHTGSAHTGSARTGSAPTGSAPRRSSPMHSSPADGDTAPPSGTVTGRDQATPAGDFRDRDEDTPRIIRLPGTEAAQANPARPDNEASPAPHGHIPAPVFMAGTQRIAFFSLKGGVGKTTLAVETAAYLARHGRWRDSPSAPERPLQVAVLDLDMQSANVSMRLGLTHPTIWDLVVDPEPGAEEIETCLVRHDRSGLRALLGPPKSVSTADGRALAITRVARVLSHLDDAGCHLVLMDLGSEVNELTTYAMEAAQRIYYVITPTASSVQDAYRGVEVLRRMGQRRKLRIVLNQARGSFDTGEMMADLGLRLDARVKRDEAFVEAETRHQPACLGGATAIAELAAAIYPALALAATARPNLWRRLLERLA